MKARLVFFSAVALLVLTTVLWSVTTSFPLTGAFYLRSIGILFAALGLVLIFLQFLFVARIKTIEAGFGLDRMLRWHRFFGRAGLIMVTLHAALIVVYRFISFGEIFPTLFIWIGLAALAGFTVTAALASLHKKIGIAYEIWRGIHLINYLLFPVVLLHVFYHTILGSALYYLWITLAGLFALVILYRLVRILAIKYHPYEVVDVRNEAEGIWSLYFKGKKINYKPGQFMFIQLLRKGKLSSPHPFTISNSPVRELLSITPKELGDFTSTIGETRVGDRAYIDAAYGVFSFLNSENDDLVFIAGGIGITPFISMLRYMKDQEIKKKITLFWVNRNEKQLCFRDELGEIEEAIPEFKAIMIMTDQPEWQGEKGRLNGEMISSYLGDLHNKDFFICGPPPMSRAIMAELKALKVPSSCLHCELFEL